MPVCGPRKPTQLTPVPLKLSVARWPTEKPSAAVPPLHPKPPWYPSTHEPAGVNVTDGLLSSTRVTVSPVELATVTDTAAEVVDCPVPSRATAVSVCGPPAAVVVFQSTSTAPSVFNTQRRAVDQELNAGHRAVV